jgi:predicted DNA-binding transcriptional regulator AlpA
MRTSSTHTELYRMKQLTEMLSMSRSFIHKLIRAEKFPPPIRLSSRAVVWPKKAIDDWLEELPPRSS